METLVIPNEAADISAADNQQISPLPLWDKTPRMWTSAAREQLKVVNEQALDQIRSECAVLCENSAREAQEKRWKELSGVEAADTTFSIIMPLHNEAAFLPSVLGAISVAVIPDSANIQFIFVTNNCTDEGATTRELHRFLQKAGSLEQRELAEDTENGKIPKLQDTGVNPVYYATNRNNLSFVHLDTSTPGKANALTLANTIAAEHGNIAMCLDGNDFPEPEAIAKLFGTAYEHIEEKKDDVVIISGNGVPVFKKTKNRFLSPLLKKAERAHRDLGMNEDIVVRAGFFAWDTQFVQEIGGVPPTAYEGFSLAARALEKGKKIGHNLEARSPKFAPEGSDMLEMGARIVRGTLQTLDRYPETKEVIEQNVHYARSFSGRVRNLIGKIGQQPTMAPFYGASFGMWEIMRRQGEKDFQSNRESQTWNSQNTKK